MQLVNKLQKSHLTLWFLCYLWHWSISQLVLPDKIQDTQLNLKYLGHWEGNRQEGQGPPNGRKRLQVSEIFFLSPLSSRRKQTTSVKFFSLKILCCHDDTWFHLNLTFLKPWVNQCVFLMELFSLSYVNETMYLLWNLPFFKIVPPKTNFFFFFSSNVGLMIDQ